VAGGFAVLGARVEVARAWQQREPWIVDVRAEAAVGRRRRGAARGGDDRGDEREGENEQSAHLAILIPGTTSGEAQPTRAFRFESCERHTTRARLRGGR